jgi:hypothetical protein
MSTPSKVRNAEPPSAPPIMALMGISGPVVALFCTGKEAVGMSAFVIVEVAVLTFEGVSVLLLWNRETE